MNEICDCNILDCEQSPKLLSEYLKENDVYDMFIENCVDYFVESNTMCRIFKEYKIPITISIAFKYRSEKQGVDFWIELFVNLPENLVYDMNEIIFTEVE